jgi:hypothetical protein
VFYLARPSRVLERWNASSQEARAARLADRFPVAMASSRLNKKYTVSWGQRFSIVYSFAATQKLNEFIIESTVTE